MRRGGSIKAVLAAALLLAASPAFAFNGYRAFAKELSRGARRRGLSRVAVLPFTPADSSSPSDGWGISERLVTQLVRLGRVEAVERGLLRRVMEEHALAQTGALDPASLRGLGRILAVEGIVTGSFTTAGSEIIVDARLIDVETGVIVAAAERTLPRDSFDSAAGWPEPGEGPRDSAADADCSTAGSRSRALEASILELKARYWVVRLSRGLPLGGGPGPGLEGRFMELVKSYASAGGARPLSPAEVRRFVSVDGEAFRLRRECGI